MQILVPLAGAFTVLALTAPCSDLVMFEPIHVIRPYEPTGRWSGHFGIDIAAAADSPVRSMGAGTVSFAGKVAGRLSVTVDHGGGIRTSYSYLASTLVAKGHRVRRGAPVGYPGVHGGTPAVHVSLRTGDTYLDPVALGTCAFTPHRGLWLASVVFLYPVMRERNPRRHIRPSPLRPSRDRTRSARTTRPRHGPSHGGR